MNGRVCQLCGKPLSRIWAGSGGDFCSREHRNQHRLRCGMDTLLEANKHASLMRRRDQLRQFPAKSLQCSSDLQPKASGPAPQVAGRPVLRRVAAGPERVTPRIDPGEAEFLSVTLSATPLGGTADEPRTAEKSSRNSMRRPVPPAERAHRLPVAISRAETVALRFHAGNGASAGRVVGSLPRTRQRAAITEGAFRALRVETPVQLSGRRTRALASAAKVGNDFLVSATNRFRASAIRLGNAELSITATPGLNWPQSLPLSRSGFSGKAHSACEPYCEIPAGGAYIPASPTIDEAAGLQAAGPFSSARRAPYEQRLEARQSEWIWPNNPVQQSMDNAVVKALHPSVGPGLVVVKVGPRQGATERRVESAPFQPGEQFLIDVSNLWNASR
jgi:hypothetical protein